MENRNLGYLINSFMISKIDDTFAEKVDISKLLELGLVYGDVIAYRQFFSTQNNVNDNNSNKVLSYKERAAELKAKIQRTHSGRVDAMNRPISVHKTYQVMFGIKCLENKKYKLKINKGFTKILDKSCTYEELHNVACTHYQSGNIERYLATYEGRRIKDSFTDLEKYAFKQR